MVSKVKSGSVFPAVRGGGTKAWKSWHQSESQINTPRKGQRPQQPCLLTSRAPSQRTKLKNDGIGKRVLNLRFQHSVKPKRKIFFFFFLRRRWLSLDLTQQKLPMALVHRSSHSLASAWGSLANESCRKVLQTGPYCCERKCGCLVCFLLLFFP